MRVYVVISSRTVGQDTDCDIFAKKADAKAYMEELTGQSEKDWTDEEYTVYEDAEYFESVAYIVEKEVK